MRDNPLIQSTIKHRRGTTLEWESNHYILKEGELGVNLDNGRMKVGDGLTSWERLPYFANEVDLEEGLTNTSYTSNGRRVTSSPVTNSS